MLAHCACCGRGPLPLRVATVRRDASPGMDYGPSLSEQTPPKTQRPSARCWPVGHGAPRCSESHRLACAMACAMRRARGPCACAGPHPSFHAAQRPNRRSQGPLPELFRPTYKVIHCKEGLPAGACATSPVTKPGPRSLQIGCAPPPRPHSSRPLGAKCPLPSVCTPF